MLGHTCHKPPLHTGAQCNLLLWVNYLLQREKQAKPLTSNTRGLRILVLKYSAVYTCLYIKNFDLQISYIQHMVILCQPPPEQMKHSQNERRNHRFDTVGCHYAVAYSRKSETTNLSVMAVNISVCQAEKHPSLVVLEKEKIANYS